MATYTDNYQLTKPTYAEQADIGVINSNMNIIDDIMHSSQISLAPAYDSTQTYAEGDVVMYELLMYKCISPTTGVWDGSKWERTTASESGGGGSAELDILGEASGAVASFADGASAELAKCIAEIEIYQEGTGTPMPDNVRPINANTTVEVTVSDGETDTTTTVYLGQMVYKGRINVLTGELTITHGQVTVGGDNSISSISDLGTNVRFWTALGSGFKTAPEQDESTSNYIPCSPRLNSYTIDRTEYRPFTAEYPQSGWIKLPKSLVGTTSESIKAYFTDHPLTIVAPLATPQTVQLTPQEVNSILGQNNISADTGDIDIIYVKASAPIQPNPTGTPTATLNKLGIEGTVFEIPSGGGGGGSSSGINYSTTEQVIGTWIDGKPLYQKTIVINGTYTGNGSFALSGITSDMVVRKYDGVIAYKEDGIFYPIGIGNNYFRYPFNSYDTISTTIGGSGSTYEYQGYLIIEYTKITD